MQSTDSKRHTTWDALQKESIFGQEKTRKQVMEEIMAEPDLYQQFLKLSPRLQEELVEFAMGVRGLNVTYDPVFKKIFDPETRKKRLEEFLSLCMKQKVKILRVLPSVKAQPGIPRCSCGGIIKPDVVLYEEALDQDTMNRSVQAISQADLMIIGGTSLVVYPAAGLVQYYRGRRLVLINKGSTSMDGNADLVISLPIGEALEMFL